MTYVDMHAMSKAKEETFGFLSLTMAAGRVLPFAISSLFFVFLVIGSFFVVRRLKDHHPNKCAPSSCVNIRNISSPFHLKHDPDNCGDKKYVLSCENNRTVLYLYSGKYYVQAINYDNHTIRVVDFNLREGDCSSMPRYSLAEYNFSSPYLGNDPYYFGGLPEPIIFMSCDTQVNSSLYVDTAPCTSPTSSSSGHVFVKIGHLNASDMRDLCRIDLTVATSWPGVKDINVSYVDIHNGLAYGFELSWRKSIYYWLILASSFISDCGMPELCK